MTDKLYAERDLMEQGQYYADHIMAMTSEKLHDKSDIAAELAHRDQQNDILRMKIELLDEQVRQLKDGEGEYSMKFFQAINEK